ncbi:MAG: HEAT repeat domain-containing protein, partial [Chroococcales cyanobacterium]
PSSAIPPPPPSPEEGLVRNEPPQLAKIDAIDTLIEQLQSRVPTQRRKAIWELGQKGDSRAMQPLVTLLMDSDSRQRSLILASLAEIGNRTLQPMNRALVLSLQDSNPEVRKNAIRDLTRIYDLVSQTSQLLRHASEDSDPEVREAAQWALSQLNRLRPGSHSESRSSLQNWSPPTETYPEDIP